MKRTILSAAVAAIALSSAAAVADTITFKNGDKITGTIVEMAEGKMKVKTAVAGDVIIDAADIATFSTDGLIDLQLADGTIVKQKVDAVSDGKVTFTSTAGQQEVAVTGLKGINPRQGWKGNLVVGGMITRGNSFTDQLNVGGKIARRSEKDRTTFYGSYNYGRQKDRGTGNKPTTTDNWVIGGKYDYFFNDKWYGWGSLQADHDRIADIEYRITPAIGVGYQWHEDSIWNFATEAGLAYVFEKYEDPAGPDPVGFDDEDGFLSLRLAYMYDRKINENFSVFHNLQYFPSLEDINNFNLWTDLGVKAKLAGNMSALAKVELVFDNQPAPGSVRSDLRYVLGVNWDF